jgi:hypothetical protein
MLKTKKLFVGWSTGLAKRENTELCWLDLYQQEFQERTRGVIPNLHRMSILLFGIFGPKVGDNIDLVV